MPYTFNDPTPLPTPDSQGYVDTGSFTNASFVADWADPDTTGKYRSAWFAHTPAEDGSIELQFEVSTNVAYLSAYTGNTQGTAVRVSAAGNTMSISFAVTAGTTYRIRIHSTTDSTFDYSMRGYVHGALPTGPGSFANPYKITIYNDSTPYVSPALANTSFLKYPVTWTDWPYPVWFVYLPAADDVVTFDTELGTQVDGTEMELYQGTDLATDTSASIIALDQNVDSIFGKWSEIQYGVTAGTPYWIRIATQNPDETFDYVLRADGPVTMSYGNGIVALPADTYTDVLQPTIGTQQADAAPIDSYTDVGGTLVRVLNAPPAESRISPRAPAFTSVRRVLGQPANNAVVPVDQPQLTVGVQPIEGSQDVITVEVQYDIAGQLTAGSPVLATTVSGGVGVILATVVTPALANGSYEWRARLVSDGTPGSWTAARTFTVDTAASDATSPITWTVTTATPQPHLWRFTPAAGVPGTPVTIYGQGLPATPTVTIGGHAAIVTDVRQVPATAAALTAARTIDDVEHDEIDITIPDTVEAPGGPLIVQGVV